MSTFRRLTLAAILVTATAILSACSDGVQKSSNPTSPMIAGPIAGVGITAPASTQPSTGTRFAVDQQPVSLVVQNSTTNGQRTVYYAFEVSADQSFATLLVNQDGVSAGTAGFTSFKLPSPLTPERTYYWRSQARDGANSSDYSNLQSFTVYTPVVLQAPAPVSPINSERVTTRTPDLTWTNAVRTGPAGPVSYAVQISTDEGFTAVVASWTQAEGTTRTITGVPSTLSYDARYYWRVRGVEASVTGPWSSAQTFLAPATPAPTPTPTPTPTPSGAADEVNLNSVIIKLGPANFASWPVTSTVTNVRQGNGELCIFHSSLGQWPSVMFFDDPNTLVEGNQWVFANIGGQWYGGAADWYRPGQACKGVDAQSIARDAFYQDSMEPLRSWVPRVGELFAVASSTPARAWPAMATLDVRTNIKTVRWQ